MHAAEKLRCHTLIAEDSPKDLQLLLASLEQASHVEFVPTLINGRDLVPYLMGRGEYANREDHPYPRLLLADLKLHQGDGVELMRWVYEHPDSGLRVIMLDDGRSGTTEESARRLGVNTFLTKPLHESDLRQISQTLEQLVQHEPKAGVRANGSWM
jgi:two-component system, response regulator